MIGIFLLLSLAAPSEDAARGKAVYAARCAECHGAAGRGDGPAAYFLSPRPRDFAAAKFKIRSTDTGTLPTDDDLIRSVRKGLPGTAMPAWESLLPDADIRDVVRYVKSFSSRFATERPTPLAAGAAPAQTPESLSRGRAVYEKLQCGKCHGTDGRGTDAAVRQFQDDWQQPMRAADLSEPWTFRGGPSTADLFTRFRTGMSGTPMPSFKDSAGDRQLRDLATYVASLARKPVWDMDAKELADFYARQDGERARDPVERGAALVESLGCPVCHSPLDSEKKMIPGLKFAGGLRIHVEPFGDYPTGNLTSDKDTGLGLWTDDEITRVITRGVLRDGTRLLPYPMDYPSFSTLTPADLTAIVSFLRTIPPIVNEVPRPTRTFLPLYLWGKFKMLFLGDDPPMVFYPGNLGSAGNNPAPAASGN